MHMHKIWAHNNKTSCLNTCLIYFKYNESTVTIHKPYIDAWTVNILNIRHLGANTRVKLDMTASLDFINHKKIMLGVKMNLLTLKFPSESIHINHNLKRLLKYLSEQVLHWFSLYS